MKKNHFITTVICVFVCLLSFNVNAQKFSKVDKSPLDIASFRTARNEAPRIKVIYSRPMKNGREIFGKLIPHGKVWRTGANECTEITFNQDVMIGGKKVNAGTYALFTIPNEKEWTIILNKDTDQWGAYNYKESNDVLRVNVPVKTTTATEAFSIAFSKEGNNAVLHMAWDTTLVSLPIQL